ncbi:T cell receptor beta chain MC.7.G5 isoform X2 [Oryzias latipes]
MSSPVQTFGFLCAWFCCQAGAVTFHQSSPLIVKEKSEVHINCRHDDSSLVVMLWYQRSEDAAMTLIGYGYETIQNYEGQLEQEFTLTRKGTVEGVLTVREASQKHSAVYFCAASTNNYDPAYFGRGTKLTVLGKKKKVTAPTRVKVLSPSEKECSSGKKTLVCVASGFYPDHVSVSWMINEETVSKGVATDSAATRYGTSYRITSRLTVSSEEWTSDIKFVCSVSFFNGTTTTYHNDSITGEAKKSPSGTELSRDKYLRITQSAKLSYIIFIVKSCIYGAFIWFVAWKLQSLAEKKRKR